MRFLILLALMSANAMAQGGKNGSDPTTVSTAAAEAGAAAVSGSHSASGAVASGGSAEASGGAATATGVGGDANASGGSASSDNSVSVETKARRQAPSVFAPAALPTAPCVVATSGGLSVPGGGLSLGRGRIDPECTLRETARMFDAFGEPEFALELLCASEAVRESGLADRCPRQPRGEVTVIVPADCSESDEKLKRCEDVTK